MYALSTLRHASAVFSSAREKLQWNWTLAIVVTIYVTFSLASTLAGVLSDQDLSAVIFPARMVLIGLTVLTHRPTTRPSGVGLEIGIATAYSMLYVAICSSTVS